MRLSRSRPLGPCSAVSLLLLGSCGGGSDGASPPFMPTEGVEVTNTTGQVSESDGVVSIAFGLPAALAQDVLVDLVVSGSALSPEDYALASLQVPIPAGALAAGVDLTLVDDSLFEADETIVLTIAGVTPADVVDIGSQNEFTLTVVDNDTAPSVSFGVLSAQVAEAGGAISIPVELSEASGVSASVDVARSGTAGAADYSLLEDTITFAPGSTTTNVVLIPTADGLNEGAESAILTLSNPSEATLGAEVVATVEITDSAAPDGWGSILFARLGGGASDSGVFSTGLPPAVAQEISDEDLFTAFYTLSPDRQRVVYSGLELSIPPSSGMFVVDSAGASQQISSPELRPSSLARWSPDQSWVAFYASPGDDLSDELFVCASDGSSCAQLTSEPIVSVQSNEELLRWSPTSNRIAFTASVSDNERHLFSARPDGGDLVDLSAQLGVFAHVQEEYVWSPDGTRLAFRSGTVLYTVPGGGGPADLITNQLSQLDDDEFDFGWAPGSSRLVYRAIDGGSGLQVFSSGPAGSNPIRISTGALWAARGWRIAPDGESVAYFGPDELSTGIELRVAAIDGSSDVLASGSLPEDFEVTECLWSPDSSRVAYRQDELFSIDLLAAEADGSGFVSIAENSGPEDFIPGLQMAWSPDGSRLAWISLRLTSSNEFENLLASNAAAGGDQRIHSGPHTIGLMSGISLIDYLWSLDSSHLILRASIDGSFGELRGVPVDGSAPEVTIPGTEEIAAALLVQYDVR